MPQNQRFIKGIKMIIKEIQKGYETRYIIVDDDGTLINDAQGYGFKSKQAAHKWYSYQFNGGRQKHDLTKSKIKNILSKCRKEGLETKLKEVKEYYDDETLWNMKDCGGDQKEFDDLQDELLDELIIKLEEFLILDEKFFEGVSKRKVYEKLFNGDY